MSRRAFLLMAFVAMSASPCGLQAGKAEAQQRTNPVSRKSQEFDFKQVREVAVYPYREKYRDLGGSNPVCPIDFILKDHHVKYIAGAFSEPTVNRTYMGSVPDAYVYFKDAFGSIKEAKIIGDFHYIMIDNNLESLYPLSDPGGRILREKVRPLREKDGLP